MKNIKLITCSLLMMGTSLVFANKNPCNVDCVNQLIANDSRAGLTQGIGYAANGLILGLSRNPSLENELYAAYNQAVATMILEANKGIKNLANRRSMVLNDGES